MKKYATIILALFLSFTVAACGNAAKGGENGSTGQGMEVIYTDSRPEEYAGAEAGRKPETGQNPESDGMEEREENAVGTDQIYIQVGENTLTAVLEDNETAEALKEFLSDGPVTIPASNYGGFEKVCSLGAELPRNDSRTTTHAGDICLYNGNQIVIFYGSNSWAYTRIGKVTDADEAELETVLGGEETQITLSLC